MFSDDDDDDFGSWHKDGCYYAGTIVSGFFPSGWIMSSAEAVHLLRPNAQLCPAFVVPFYTWTRLQHISLVVFRTTQSHVLHGFQSDIHAGSC